MLHLFSYPELSPHLFLQTRFGFDSEARTVGAETAGPSITGWCDDGFCWRSCDCCPYKSPRHKGHHNDASGLDCKGQRNMQRPRCSRDGRAHVLKSSLISVLRDSLWGRCYRSSGRLGAQRNAICPSDLADLVATGASHQIGCSHGGQGAILSFCRRSPSLAAVQRKREREKWSGHGLGRQVRSVVGSG